MILYPHISLSSETKRFFFNCATFIVNLKGSNHAAPCRLTQIRICTKSATIENRTCQSQRKECAENIQQVSNQLSYCHWKRLALCIQFPGKISCLYYTSINSAPMCIHHDVSHIIVPISVLLQMETDQKNLRKWHKIG